ncbi:MAG: hypothetical protein AB9869_27270 [Verrucomicrobiia bacterium]
MADPKPIAWCWQDKAALRKIREHVENYGSALAVYCALTVVASDKQSEVFETTHDWLAHLSGFGWRTVLERLKDLQKLGILEITTPKLKRPSTYRLVRPALSAARPATNAERSAKIGPLSLQSSEEMEQSIRDHQKDSDRKLLLEAQR